MNLIGGQTDLDSAIDKGNMDWGDVELASDSFQLDGQIESLGGGQSMGQDG